MERDQEVVGVSAAVEGGNRFAYKFFEGTEDEEKELVGKEGNDENVDEENA